MEDFDGRGLNAVMEQKGRGPVLDVVGLEPVGGRRPEVPAVEVVPLAPVVPLALDLDDVVALRPAGWKFDRIENLYWDVQLKSVKGCWSDIGLLLRML